MNPFAIDYIIWSALILLGTGFILSLLFFFAGSKTSGAEKRINNLLPGMNCGQCGYIGCAKYAEALIKGEAVPNLCRPGGPDLVQLLADALGISAQEPEDYDEQLFSPRQVAYIHPQSCNGCGKCTRSCKADAITGISKQPHLVNSAFCIGCTDCIKACTHECIEMIRLPPDPRHFNWDIKSVQITTGRK